MAERAPPRFYGVTTFRDQLGRFSFRYPTNWHRFDLEGRDGIRVAPALDDPETWFTASVEPLDVVVVAEDLDDLKRGVVEGLAELPDCIVEEGSEVILGNLIKFERVFTFSADGIIRKRKFWILYVDKWLIMLAWQGSTRDEYAYWEPMAAYAYQTFEIPQALWFATDRDILGITTPGNEG
jgi:hypothetical protein